MTTRSFESLASERRLKNRVTDDDLFKQVPLVSILPYVYLLSSPAVTLSVLRVSSLSPGRCCKLTHPPQLPDLPPHSQALRIFDHVIGHLKRLTG